MKTHFFAIVTLLFAVLANAEKSCMETAVSDSDYNECASHEFDSAEAVLNATYKEALSALSKGGPDGLETKKELIQAQRYWIQFRKSDCDAIYAFNQGGSVRIPEAFMCMKRHAEQRTKELHQFY